MSVFIRQSGGFASRRHRRSVAIERPGIEGLERRLCLSALAFHPEAHYGAVVNNAGGQVVVGDFNNDHKPDLVVSNYLNEAIYVYDNKGGGVFDSPRAIGGRGFPFSLAVGDFNHDGASDLAVGLIYDGPQNGSELVIYLGLGDGTFVQQDPIELTLRPDSMAVADFNGDGRQDLAFTGGDDKFVGVLIGSGDGSFNTLVYYHITGFGSSVIVDDFDGDHALDLAVTSLPTSGPGYLNILYGHTITDPNDPEGQIPDGTFVQPVGPYSVGQGPVAIASGRFNGDSIEDLAVANAISGTVSVLLGDPEALFIPTPQNVIGTTPVSIGVGDFSGSGHLDLAVAAGDTVKIRQGNGDGTFQLPKSFPIDSQNAGSLAVADLNADGTPDIAVADNTGVSVLIAGTGDVAAPRAALAQALTGVGSPGGTAYTFKVKFTDDKAVNASTLASGAVSVSGPHMYGQLASLVSVDAAGNGTPRTATYKITPPGGSWDAGDNGTYTVALFGGKVADTAGNLAAATTLGTFAVKIVLGSIGGYAFKDLNANGVNDPGDTRLANVRVYLDANKNGKFDSSEKSQLTDGMGGYQFTNLAAGTYRISEVLPAGFRVSSPTAGFYDIALAAGQIANNKAFANTARPLLSGMIFNDANGDGVKQSTEKGLANWTVFLDTNKNGALDPGETRTLTDASGNYAFGAINAGSYRVREVIKAGTRRTSPAAGYYDVTLAAGAAATGKSFGDTSNVLISGTVFNDANGNKLRDSVNNVLEKGLANWRVYVDANHNGVFDSGETSTLTDSTGNWIFQTLQARSAAYLIRAVTQSGWTRTTPTAGTPAGSLSVTLASAGTSRTGLFFGEKHA